MLLTLWALTHRYDGFSRDGQLYAFQALARLQPALGTDIYLQNTSQDQFTIFSPLYATLIKIFGLQTAELLLFSVCTAWFLTAAWILGAKLSTKDTAWFSVALLIVTVGHYGAYQVFNYTENYLTARSLGEALTVTALACHFYERRGFALILGVMALLVHPLMSLPGVLLLACLWLPFRVALGVAAAGVLGTLGFAVVATLLRASSGFAMLMDPAWLEVVRERSQFLFLQYWDTADWEIAARPFVCLTLTAAIIPDPRIKQLSLSAMLVGACGMAVAAIAGSVGPIAVLLQGQAWRWMWVTTFVSLLLVAPTAVRAWRDPRCGPLSAILLVLGWTYSGVDGLAYVAGALLLWLLRPKISVTSARHLKWAAALIGGVIVIYIMVNSWTAARTAIPESGRESVLAGRLREIFALSFSGLAVMWLCWYGIRKLRSVWAISLVCAVLLGTTAWILPSSMKQLHTVGSVAEIHQFDDWRTAIPPSSNVLLLPPAKAASFVWFTLQRPSYLSVGQSAGVVFSRATAAEVRRRSEVLLPVANIDWKILTAIRAAKTRRPIATSAADSISLQKPLTDSKVAAGTKHLTAESLTHVCSDPILGFVIAQEQVGYDPLPHTLPGAFKGWNLYDCSRVRTGLP